jgi:hypothetical protein
MRKHPFTIDQEIIERSIGNNIPEIFAKIDKIRQERRQRQRLIFVNIVSWLIVLAIVSFILWLFF